MTGRKVFTVYNQLRYNSSQHKRSNKERKGLIIPPTFLKPIKEQSYLSGNYYPADRTKVRT